MLVLLVVEVALRDELDVVTDARVMYLLGEGELGLEMESSSSKGWSYVKLMCATFLPFASFRKPRRVY
jgi:hypothetical protein